MVSLKEERKRTIKSNKSLYFLLPMLKIVYTSNRNNIINTYIGDKLNKPKLDNFHLFLLVKQEDEKLLNTNTYIEHYSVDEGSMYVYKIPTEFEEDYLKFILGQYSQFSVEYKQQIINLLPSPYQSNNIFKIIMKTDDARKVIEDKVGQSIGSQEVCSIPNYNEEIYE